MPAPRCDCWTRWAVRRRWRRPAPATSGSSPRHIPGGARCLLARGVVGPERRPPGDVTGRRHAPRRRGPVACRPAPAAGGDRRRLRHRCDRGQRGVPRRGSGRRARRGRLGHPGRRAVRRPPFDVVIGEQAHSTLSKSLGLVGLGRERWRRRPRRRAGADARRSAARPPRAVLVCAEAGEVNTGAFDPFVEIADWLAGRTGWLHVDAAFGLLGPRRPQPGAARRRPRSGRARGRRRRPPSGSTSRMSSGIAFVRRRGDLRLRSPPWPVTCRPTPGSRRCTTRRSPPSVPWSRRRGVGMLRTLGRQGGWPKPGGPVRAMPR